MAKKIALITGAFSGFGRQIAEALAGAGYIAYASMRDLTGRNAAQRQAVASYAREHAVDLRALELDVQSEPSVSAAIAKLLTEHGRLDILVHNAGHMVWGPSEAFTPEQLAEPTASLQVSGWTGRPAARL